MTIRTPRTRGLLPLSLSQPPRAASRQPSARPRSGFSLIEMIVVIGIILVLMGMAVIGYRYVQGNAAADRTRTYLHNAEAMVTELDRTGQGWLLEGNSAMGSLYNTGYAIDVTSPPGSATPLTDVSENNLSARQEANYLSSNVLAVLLRVQANQTAWGQWPPKGQVPNSGNATASPVIPPAIADGWGNPIIWVPSGGLKNVVVNGNTVTITSPDGRGFWASAGPDGDFTKGDDNHYSFER